MDEDNNAGLYYGVGITLMLKVYVLLHIIYVLLN